MKYVYEWQFVMIGL